MARARAFTAGQRAYLCSLDAVDRVDGSSRIYYADWFRVECMRRYQAGEKPAALFREAGLDPKLIGYKRVERAFARWRYLERVCAQNETGTPMLAPGKPADSRDRLIAAQALRIQQLEEEVHTLKHT